MEKVAEEIKKDNHSARLQGARYVAVRLLSRYDRSDSYVDKLLAHELADTQLESRDKALLTELVNGVIRWKAKLDWVLTGFYHGDYSKCLNIIKNAMRVGLYQIQFLNKIPIYSAIDESVEIVKRIQGPKTAGIVNGVLRNIARNLDNIRYPVKDKDQVYYLAIFYSHPKWMVKRWIQRYGYDETERLLQYNNRRPDVPIRVNLLKAEQEEIKKIFEENDISVNKVPYIEQSLILKSPKLDIASNNLFTEGKITVQDPSASMAAMLVNASTGSDVLDICAAPGGKSFFLAEMMNNEGTVTAVDSYTNKISMITEGADRLGFSCINAELADARNYSPGKLFDAVIADVPCSGLGTLTKKPDIKWKRDIDDIPKIQNLQRKIMENAAKLVKPRGAFVYSTCTIEPEENEDNIKWFLDNNPDFEIEPADNYLPSELCEDGFMKTLPHKHFMDGAFAARLIRKKISLIVYY